MASDGWAGEREKQSNAEEQTEPITVWVLSSLSCPPPSVEIYNSSSVIPSSEMLPNQKLSFSVIYLATELDAFYHEAAVVAVSSSVWQSTCITLDNGGDVHAALDHTGTTRWRAFPKPENSEFWNASGSVSQVNDHGPRFQKFLVIDLTCQFLSLCFFPKLIFFSLEWTIYLTTIWNDLFRSHSSTDLQWWKSFYCKRSSWLTTVLMKDSVM